MMSGQTDETYMTVPEGIVMPTAAGYDLFRDESSQLVFVDDTGQRHVGVIPLRTFPISEPEGCISLLAEPGREIAFFDSLNSLPERAATLMRRELACREFVPVIRRIVSLTEDSDLPRWQLETDRGDTDVQVHIDDGLRRLGEHGLLVVDIHGLRFLIPHTAELDAASRGVLDRYL
ncbi:MAG: DUF1854 domain-containing protein [Pirellulaceae bacterium]